MSSQKNREDLKQLIRRELERENERLRRLNDLYQAENLRLKDDRKQIATLESEVRQAWRDQMLKTDILFAPKDEQLQFYRKLLWVFWLSPRVRNAIIREFGPEIGFASVGAYNADRNDRKAAILENAIVRFKTWAKKTGDYKGDLHNAALEHAGHGVLGMSANAVKVFLHRYRAAERGIAPLNK